ncbi:unnamed protein product, partial [Effrenium voratum]
MSVMASSEKSLETLVSRIEALAAETNVGFRRAAQGALLPKEAEAPSTAPGPKKKVLVLGAGHVCAPLVAYLAKAGCELLVASVERRDLEQL